jgi:anti-sigma B factor antagonist
MLSEPPFEATVAYEADRMIVRLSGEIDNYTAPRLRKVLDDALREKPSTLVVDLEGVTFLDSRGLSTLVHGNLAAPEHGTNMTVVNPRPGVRKTLEITGLGYMVTEPPAGATE